jgi:hypothetical protein
MPDVESARTGCSVSQMMTSGRKQALADCLAGMRANTVLCSMCDCVSLWPGPGGYLRWRCIRSSSQEQFIICRDERQEAGGDRGKVPSACDRAGARTAAGLVNVRTSWMYPRVLTALKRWVVRRGLPPHSRPSIPGALYRVLAPITAWPVFALD